MSCWPTAASTTAPLQHLLAHAAAAARAILMLSSVIPAAASCRCCCSSYCRPKVCTTVMPSISTAAASHCCCYYRPAVCMSVMLSPLSRMRPRGLRVLRLTESSSASSSTRFMYSSKPMMRPSTRMSGWSYNHTKMRALLCRNLQWGVWGAATGGMRNKGRQLCIPGVLAV